MGDPKIKISQEIIQGIEKFLIWLIYITIGVIAKLAFDSRKNHLTIRQIIIKTVLSIFVGFITAVACENFNYQKMGKLAVPVATLLGEGIIVYIMVNWREMLNNLLPAWFRKIDNKK